MTELDELKEALAKFNDQKLNEISLTYAEQDAIATASQKYLELAPLLEEMAEALKKIKPNDSINNSVNNMTNFSRIAMDKTRQITEIMERNDE